MLSQLATGAVILRPGKSKTVSCISSNSTLGFAATGAKTIAEANLRRLFGKRYRDRKILANWFSGTLKMPDGKMLQYVHMGYGSVYEREIMLAVESGKVVAESTVDNTQRTLPSELELQRSELEKIKPKPPH